MDGRDPDTIAIPAPIRGFVIDAPYRWDSDADVRPLLYAGAGAYAGSAFPGAVIYEATGSGTSLAYDQLFAGITGGAAWGLCSGVLGDVPSPWLWDRGNTLTVSLQSGSLTSVDRGGHRRRPTLNLILVGAPAIGNMCNFTTATLNGDGSYTLSGFKRGRRGTEWACGGHEAGEAWILASSLELEEMGGDDIGDSAELQGAGDRAVARRRGRDRRRPVFGRHAEALCAGEHRLELGRHEPDGHDRSAHPDRRSVGGRLDHPAQREQRSL
jgi:hypothetical protein